MHHKYKRDIVSHPNVRVDRAATGNNRRPTEQVKEHALSAPVQRRLGAAFEEAEFFFCFGYSKFLG